MTQQPTAGTWLATVRRAAGLTQVDTAWRAGITVRAYQAIEAGRRPTPKTMHAIATTLGLDPAGRRHLDRLMHPPRTAPAPPPADHLHQLLAHISAPAWAVDPAWTVLAASPSAPATPANLALWAIDAAAKFDDWPRVSAELVARTRSTLSWYETAGESVQSVVTAIREASPAADLAWSAGRVADVPHREVLAFAGRSLTLHWASVGDDPSARLVVITGRNARHSDGSHPQCVVPNVPLRTTAPGRPPSPAEAQ
ncbi:helix-turn-helix domain-containing protein [Micromonospora sp. NPDC007271]|uniref:helix-turn-helix domain-containing protein n=1 Tax=Micromonospora sp. NPDC007271 TaxID=3154587 RepID=UPI00340F1CF1